MSTLAEVTLFVMARSVEVAGIHVQEKRQNAGPQSPSEWQLTGHLGCLLSNTFDPSSARPGHL